VFGQLECNGSANHSAADDGNIEFLHATILAGSCASGRSATAPRSAWLVVRCLAQFESTSVRLLDRCGQVMMRFGIDRGVVKENL
jgi:hypothetical protein